MIFLGGEMKDSCNCAGCYFKPTSCFLPQGGVQWDCELATTRKGCEKPKVLIGFVERTDTILKME